MDGCSRFHSSMEEWRFAVGRMSVPGKEVGAELGAEGEAGFCLGHGQGEAGYEPCLAEDST